MAKDMRTTQSIASLPCQDSGPNPDRNSAYPETLLNVSFWCICPPLPNGDAAAAQSACWLYPSRFDLINVLSIVARKSWMSSAAAVACLLMSRGKNPSEASKVLRLYYSPYVMVHTNAALFRSDRHWNHCSLYLGGFVCIGVSIIFRHRQKFCVA